MNSRLTNILVGIFLGIVIAFLFALKPWLGLGGMVAIGLVYFRTLKATWQRFSHQDAELVNQASRQELDPVRAYYIRGQARLSQQDYDGAIADFNRVIDIDENFGAAYYYRALALIEISRDTIMLQEELEEVMADLKTAADLAQQNQEEQLYQEIDRTRAALVQSPNNQPDWLQKTAADLN